MVCTLCLLCCLLQGAVHAVLANTRCGACCARFAARCRLLCTLCMLCCLTQAAVHAAHAVLPDAWCTVHADFVVLTAWLGSLLAPIDTRPQSHKCTDTCTPLLAQ